MVTAEWITCHCGSLCSLNVRFQTMWVLGALKLQSKKKNVIPILTWYMIFFFFSCVLKSVPESSTYPYTQQLLHHDDLFPHIMSWPKYSSLDITVPVSPVSSRLVGVGVCNSPAWSHTAHPGIAMPSMCFYTTPVSHSVWLIDWLIGTLRREIILLCIFRQDWSHLATAVMSFLNILSFL